MGATYRTIRGWARILVTTWYRTRRHGPPVPAGGPVVLVVNHSNGLVDGHFQLAVTDRPVRVLAKFKLFAMPVLGWLIRSIGAIPIYRKKDGVDTALNADSFRAIHASLAAGDVIAIFPEGESRGTPYLREIKTGAARMALGAEEAAGWAAGVRIVPVGITYADVERFRSRAEAWVGESFGVGDLRGTYDTSPVLAYRELTARIRKALGCLVLEVPPGDDEGRAARALAFAVERLLPPTDEPLAARRQRGFDAFERLRARDPEGHDRRVEAALELDRNVTGFGLTAADVFDPALPTPGSVVREIVARTLLGTPALALALVPWGPPVLLARCIGRRGASTPDKFVTVTLLVTFCGLLLWTGALAWLALARLAPPADLVAVLLLAAGVAAFPRAVDNLRALARARGRLRLAADPAARARLAETLTRFAATLEKA